MNLLLVDSSAWIDFFVRSAQTKLSEKIEEAKKEKRLATCDMIYLEILRGARNEKEYGELTEEFTSMLWLPIDGGHWHFASQMGFQLAKKGTHPPATDLLIASVSIVEKCQLLHKDKHFPKIAEYFPLKLV